MTNVAGFDDTNAEQKLAATRARFREILHPEGERSTTGGFPRSRTMRALTGGGATSALALVAVAVLATRPGVAGRLARATPIINLLRQFGLGLR